MYKNCFLVLLLAIYSSCCLSQETGCFIETANREIELDTKIDFSPYYGFFVGEVHADGRQGMKLALLKYLNKQFGITDVFMELGYNAAFLYNRYLATGDVTLVSSRYNQWYKTEEDKLFWKNLYEYNKTLDKKIVIRGMDYENSQFYKTLYLLMPEGKGKPAEISKTLSWIEKKGPRKHLFVSPDYNKVKKEIYNNIDLYKQYYGDNFSTVADVMFNPTNIESSVAYAKENAERIRNTGEVSGTIIYRDSTNCRNVMKQIDQYAIKKFIVFVGMMHTYKMRKNSLYNNIKNASANDNYVNIALTFKNTDTDAKYRDKYRYLLAIDKNNKEVSYDTNYAMLDKIYEKHFNKGCKYTMINVNNIKTDGIGTDLKNYTDYLVMMEGKW